MSRELLSYQRIVEIAKEREARDRIEAERNLRQYDREGRICKTPSGEAFVARVKQAGLR